MFTSVALRGPRLNRTFTRVALTCARTTPTHWGRVCVWLMTTVPFANKAAMCGVFLSSCSIIVEVSCRASFRTGGALRFPGSRSHCNGSQLRTNERPHLETHCTEMTDCSTTEPASLSVVPLNMSRGNDFVCKVEVVQYIDFLSLISLRGVSKHIRDVIDKSPEDIDYWRSLCNSYFFYAGVYSFIAAAPFVRMDYKKYFFSELWSIRDKWELSSSENGASSGQEYKIRVANRFRPGVISSEKVCLPLHQFLKVKRHQKQQQNKAATEEGDSSLLVGEADPEEFVDPLLGTLMKDPVRLGTSGRVVDRAVAVQCVLRGGRDPFDGQRLTAAMLVPQPELAERILEFRRRKQQLDVSVGRDELKPLVDDQEVDADLLEALMEVERMNSAARRAASEAAIDEAHTDNHEDNGVAGIAAGPEVGDGEGGAAMEAVDPAAIAAEEILQAHILEAQVASMHIANGVDPSGGEHYNPISRKVERAGIVEVNDRTSCVTMHVPGAGVRPFHYAAVHKGDATQQQVYSKSAQDAVAAALNGLNACIMCYGQTGSGKTHTFFGPDGLLHANVEDASVWQQRRQRDQQGLVMRACEELLLAKDFLAQNGISVSFTAQFVEIYEEQVTDLLTGHTATIRRETGAIAGAVEAPFNCVEQVMEALRVGHDRKRFAATEMNERSSRSHTALVIHVLQKLNSEKMGRFAEQGPSGLCSALRQCATEGGDRMLRSQLHLVDLAGSERVKKSKVEGVRLREAVGINSSLLVLGKVISALVEGKSHVPYYESKLTTMLKAAFGGNSRTTVVINCRADAEHGDETLQSMRFGERCGMVTNSMRAVASSFNTALQAVDKALVTVQGQLSSLEARGKQHLPSYKSLLHSFQLLERKRKELVGINAAAQVLQPVESVAPEGKGNQAEADDMLVV